MLHFPIDKNCPQCGQAMLRQQSAMRGLVCYSCIGHFYVEMPPCVDRNLWLKSMNYKTSIAEFSAKLSARNLDMRLELFGNNGPRQIRAFALP